MLSNKVHLVGTYFY